MVVLEIGYPPELRGALRRADGCLRVVHAPFLNQVQRQLVLGEAHLDDAPGVIVQVERVHVVGLPPVEVRRVLAVPVPGSNP
uniref:Acs7 n=1 Tax=Arundo donax TaxID=35708 RepID=A0A0A8YXY1_ARUDO